MNNDDTILDNQFANNFSNPNRPPQPQPLPNSVATLVLGICSIVTCFCYAVPGLICGIIALVISKQSVQLYKENPDAYSDYSTLHAGRICAIIGTSMSGVTLLLGVIYMIAIFSMIGSQGDLFNR